MKIKDKEGITHIEFKDFQRLRGNIQQVFITFNVIITISGFSAKSQIKAELSDFIEMLTNLEIHYKTLTGTFYFQHIDERLKIEFIFGATGNIDISGTLKSEDYQTSLEFEFTTDQTFTPDLIEECRKIVHSLS